MSADQEKLLTIVCKPLTKKEGKIKKNGFMGMWGAISVSVVFLLTMIPTPGVAAEGKTCKLHCGAGQPYSPVFQFIVSLENYFCRELEKRVVERTEKYESGELKPDPDTWDDQGLIFDVKNKGLVILQSCSHSGTINNIQYGKKLIGQKIQ